MRKILIASVGLLIMLSFANVTHAQVYVEKGDTLFNIAKRNNMTLNDLIELNQHIENPNIIYPGDYIIIRTETETQKDLIDYARSLQDVTTYVYGGQNAPYETDCSGWVQHVYKKFGVDLPRTSAQQSLTGEPIPFEELQQGDLMFFSTRDDKKITHVGIFMGEDYWISNLNERTDVEILSTWGKWTRAFFMWGARHKI